MRYALPLLLLGCRVSGEDLSPSSRLPAATLDAPLPPPADTPREERLYQLLYAGEVGPTAHAVGQRVRVRAWLKSMALTVPQRQGLTTLVATVAQEQKALDAARAAADTKETEALLPLYAELDQRLAGTLPSTDTELEDLAKRLAAARQLTATTPTWAEARRERVRRMLDAAGQWISKLQRRQQERLAESRFFLARRMNPLGNVADDETLVGVAWDGGDFSALDTTGAAPDQPQMDIGGLWAVEKLRAPPGEYLQVRRLQAIVVMAAQEPALAEVLAAEPAGAAPGTAEAPPPLAAVPPAPQPSTTSSPR